jgi:uncharacterized protein (TIGR00369 family)
MSESPLAPPEGFTPLPQGLGFNDALAPVYIKVDDKGWTCGFHVAEHHLNPAGICHGGVLMTLVDLTMAGMIGHHINQMLGVFTVNLNVDFLAPGRLGDWLEFHCHHLHTTKVLATVSGVLVGPAGIVARANGIFRLPKAAQAS